MPRSALITITALVLLRQIVGTIHGYAHLLLDIPMAHWQHLFINVVIGAGPFLALVALWWYRMAAAGWLVVAVVAAGTLFGLYFHFGPPNPDHVTMLPDLPGRTLFINSAWLLAIVEVITLAVTSWLILKHSSRSASYEQRIA